MRTLLVCERDPACGWATIARADSMLAHAKLLRAKHHAKHDMKSATPAKGRDEGSASRPGFSCACCAMNVFMPHGVGHFGPIAKSAAA